MENRITRLFNIKYPIISGGMVWCSGWRLASAVSNAGGLGLLGAGSMTPDLLREHIQKCKAATTKPFGVNLPLIYSRIEEMIEVIIEEKVEVVFTSAGNPSTWTKKLKENNIIVVHVTASSRFAQKAEAAGVDAVVAEGFEAGGHNGKEETTTMVLIPAVTRSVTIPVIAAGGIATGSSVLACMALGAEGVQIGSRFALAVESSASEEFKRRSLSLAEGDTMLTLKSVGSVRMIKNDVFQTIDKAEKNCATDEQLREIMGKGRTRQGIFEGDLKEGFLEIGQVARMVDKIESVDEIFNEIIKEYNSIKIEQL